MFGSSLGYLIPKGWKVLPLFRNIHHSPNNFKDPEKFDPSRFEVIIEHELLCITIYHSFVLFFCLPIHVLIQKIHEFDRFY